MVLISIEGKKMSANSRRHLRLVRRTMNSVSRRGLEFVRRASVGGVVAVSLFAAAEVSGQIVVPPDASGTADNVSSSFGAQSITLNGGTLTLNAARTAALHERFYSNFDDAFADANINSLDRSNSNSLINFGTNFTGELQAPLSYLDAAAFEGRTGFPFPDDFIGGVWFGEINVGGPNLAAGNIIFATNSDDGSSLFVDRNQDGDFTDSGEFIVSNLGGHGDRRRAANINLAAGRYKFVTGFYEGSGGETMEARFDTGTAPTPAPANTTDVAQATYESWNIIDPSDPTQAGIWTAPAHYPNFSANNVTVTANATIAADVGPAGETRLGALSIAPGVTLTTTGGSIAAGPLTTTGGTVTKAGGGQLGIAPGNGVAAGTTIDVRGGTLEITNTGAGVTSVNSAPITLSGGTLSVASVGIEGASSPGWWGRFYSGFTGNNANVFTPFSGLDSRTPVGTAFTPTVDFASSNTNPFDTLGVVLPNDDHSARFTGKINITTAGDYQFSTTSDDGSVMWLDRNNDGDFFDFGEEVVNNRFDHGLQERVSANIPLTAGQYRVKVEFYERGGGSAVTAKYGPAGALEVIPESVMTGHVLSAPDYKSNVNVVENSSIQARGDFAPRFGDLSIAANKTLTIGEGTPVEFDSTNLPSGAATITGDGDMLAGRVVDGTNTTTLNKTGAGRLILTNTTSDFDGTTIDVQGGTLLVRNPGTGGNPLGASAVTLSGGTLGFDTTSQNFTTVGNLTGRFYDLGAAGLTGTNAVFVPGTGLDALVPVETVNTVTQINFPSVGDPSHPFTSLGVNLPTNDHASRFTGQITIATAQDVTFFTNSDDGSVMWIDLNNDGDFLDPNEEVVDNRGDHGMQVREGTRSLAAGNYNIKVEQYERGGGSGIIAGIAPSFNNNVTVTVNSTVDSVGQSSAAINNLTINSGLTLTKTGANRFRAASTILNGNATFATNAGDFAPGRIVESASGGTLTKSGAGGLFLDNSTSDLDATTINLTGDGLTTAAAANSFGANGAVAVNLNRGDIRATHADALAGGATPFNVGDSSFIDLDVDQSASRRINVAPFGALVGQLGNLTYGPSGPGNVTVTTNSILGPDAGETNVPTQAQLAGSRLLLGLTTNNQTATVGGDAASADPTDIYRGAAIGDWLPGGNIAVNLTSLAGNPLNVHLASPAPLAGNVTARTIQGGAGGAMFNPANGVVNMTGQGRYILTGGEIGGTWTTLNRTGDPDFLGANNTLVETAATGVFTAAQTVNLRHGSYNLAGSAQGGGSVQGIFNILEGGTLVADDTQANSPNTGTYNIAGAAGTTLDLNGNGSIGPGETSVGPGAIWTNQNNQNSLGAGATFNVAPGFLLVLDHDNSTNNAYQDIISKADVILDDGGEADNFNAPIVLGNGRRLTTSATQDADINDNTGLTLVTADPALAGTAGARVILSAAAGRTLDINNRGTDRQPDFTGVDLQINDHNSFTTVQGGANRAFADMRVGRVTAAQTGRVRLAGVKAKSITIQGGRVDFEDSQLVVLDPGGNGNITVEEGLLFIDDNDNFQPLWESGSFGRPEAEFIIHDGGEVQPEIDQLASPTVRNITQKFVVPAGQTAGARLNIDQGGGSGGTRVNLTRVSIGAGSTLELGEEGGAEVNATIDATAGNATIRNVDSDTNIRVNVNAGATPLTFTGNNFTRVNGTLTASAVNVGAGTTTEGRLLIRANSELSTTQLNVRTLGTLQFEAPAGQSLTYTGALSNDGTVIFGSTMHLAGWNVGAGGKATVTPGANKVLVSNVPTIAGAPGAWTGTIDLTDNDAVFQSSAATKAADFARAYDYLKTGFGAGTWAGMGINSSTAAANTNADTGLTVVDNALLGLTQFGTEAVTANSILLKYTYYGDIDQNGQVDADDLTVFASNFGRTSGATQVDGDIDFNGTVDADDLTIFANNFNKGVGSPLVGGAGVQAVPEPASLVLAGLGAAGVLAGLAVRRRRTH
jgi:hypothetical protein